MRYIGIFVMTAPLEIGWPYARAMILHNLGFATICNEFVPVVRPVFDIRPTKTFNYFFDYDIFIGIG